MRRIIFISILGVFFIVLLQNMRTVPLQILFWEMRMPLVVFCALVLMAGMGFGFILGKRS